MESIFKLILLIVLVANTNIVKGQTNLTWYDIDAKLDTTKLNLNCKMKVNWFNNSDSIIKEIPFIFKHDSARTLVKNIKVNGKKLDYSYVSKNNYGYDGFIINLQQPIASHSNEVMEIEFKTIENEYFRDKILFFSEDFPIIQFFENGKFNANYQVHSNYQVNISFPSDFKIATTGIIYKTNSKDGYFTVKTKANSVPSYGFLLLKEVLVKELEISGVLVRSFFFQDDKKWGENLLNYSKDIILFYKESLGFYPQPILNIIPGYDKPYGGWPICPNIVGIHRGIDDKGKNAQDFAKWIMAHEIGHQYWGFNYILDPVDYPQWLGISMGIYTDELYASAKKVKKNYNRSFFYSYVKAASKGINTTIMQKTDSLDKQNFDWNNVILHGKSWAVLQLLSYELGEETFFKVYKYILDNYKGINVTIDDFKRECERISNKDLNSFFETWFYSNSFLEYQIEYVQINKNLVNLEIKNLGSTSFSNIDIEFVLNNNDTIRDQFDGMKDETFISKEFNFPIKEILLDPKDKLPLVNKKNWINESSGDNLK